MDEMGDSDETGGGKGSGSGSAPDGAALDLTGKLLIAMPGMGDPRFEHAVVYLCAHSDEGAMGLIINKPTADIHFRDLLKQLDLPVSPEVPAIPVHFGGPVEHARGFVLHSADFTSKAQSLDVDEGIRMTGTLDVLEAMGRGFGPDKALMALGYAGWGPGQLEGEIAQNAWLTCDASADLIFGSDDGKWEAALAVLGVSALSLSSAAGRA